MVRKPRYRGPNDAAAYTEHLLSLGIRTQTGCLEWPYGHKQGGYGIVNPPPGKGTTLITRYVYGALHGVKLSRQDQILHRCDNPPCYEPDHLRLGTNRDNQQDADRKGRSRRRGRLIITDEQVAELRELGQTTDLTQRELGAMFGLKQSTVSKILNHKDRITTKEVHFG